MSPRPSVHLCVSARERHPTTLPCPTYQTTDWPIRKPAFVCSYDVVRLVRERHPTLMLPVILVSANSREEHVVEGLQVNLQYTLSALLLLACATCGCSC